MSQSLIVAGSVELQLDTLAERVAQRVVEATDELAGAVAARVVEQLHADAAAAAAGGGSEVYDRPADPDPGPGGRQGARFGGVVSDQGDVEHDPEPGR